MNAQDWNKREAGIYQKFVCYRADGRDKPGEEREEAEYFVMDYRYDPHAWIAAAGYAVTCDEEYPDLSIDLSRRLLTLYPAMLKHKNNTEVILNLLRATGDPAPTFEESALYRLMIRYSTKKGGSLPPAITGVPSEVNAGGSA